MTKKIFIMALIVLMAQFPAYSNCLEIMTDVNVLKAPMERLLQKVKDEKGYNFTLKKNIITLTPEFDKLTGKQKMEILSMLNLAGQTKDWGDFLTPEEKKSMDAKGELIYAGIPFDVYASDGRPVLMVYDTCNTFTLFTEYDRHQMLFRLHEMPRKIKFPLSAKKENVVKRKFWEIAGYKNEGDYWISWVPELGYFEIDIPSAKELNGKFMTRFKKIAPKGYKYVVLDSTGTTLSEDFLKN